MKLGIISSHARLCMRRSGISEQALHNLLASGRVEHGDHGGKIVHFDTASKTCAALAGMYYAVLDSHGEIITIGRRFSHVRRRNRCYRDLRI